MILEKMPADESFFNAVIIPCFTADRRVVILQKRPDHRIYPGLWGFPAGKAGPGEGILEAAQREILEETGNRIPIEKIENMGIVLPTRHTRRRGEPFYFQAHILSLKEGSYIGEVAIDPAEHAGYAIERPENILLNLDRPMIEDARETFRMFCELTGIVTKAT